MKVTSKTSISFPDIPWCISADEIKELPENKKDQARILEEPNIILIKETSKQLDPTTKK